MKTIAINPEQGRLSVDFTVDNITRTCLVEFGSSFTLRLEEYDLSQLIDALQSELDVIRETRRRGRIAEDDFVQSGIEGREKLKTLQKLKRSEQQEVDVWDPQDPVNW
jgi:hypothetical protein